MAVKRGKSQARRNNGNSSGLPGWAWLVLGVVLTLVVILAAPKFLKSEGQDGFFRPRPNPDAQPATASGDADDTGVVPEAGNDDNDGRAREAPKPKEPEFDFYTLLPGQEVAMSDAELAASAREEAALAKREQAQQAAASQSTAAQANANATSTETAAVNTAPSTTPATATAATTVAATPVAAAADNDVRYILQAGAFGASGDAEALKAKIALLGLGARVESANINGKTMYRVRMGPYGSASELAEAKAKLGNGGLPAMAVKVK